MHPKFQEFIKLMSDKLTAISRAVQETYQRNFGRDAEQTPPLGETKRRSDLDTMHDESRRKLDRAVNALTNQAVSSSRGVSKPPKKKVVTSKTYKPQLDRF